VNQRTNQSLTWRTYLGQLLDVPTEKQRVANALGVSSLTLTRWVNGTTEPRPGSLKKLPSVFPQH
jgi:transcriptional regulator with XRE-family HTH domain